MMITDIATFFSKGCGRCARFATTDCSAHRWRDGLSILRQICRDAGLEETVKWGHPCYMHSNRNIAIIGAFREDFRLTFFNAALMTDPEGILERQGANTRNPDMIRFTADDRAKEIAPIIQAYLEEAKSYAEKGLKPPRDDSEPDYPDELVEALEGDPELAEAFHNLTPGRRKSYVINLSSAKQPETRIKRIEKFRDKILSGKGALER